MIIKSPEEFKKLSAFDKGYFVYMLGGRDDEPYVSKRYFPLKKEEEDYLDGAHCAVIIVQDNP